LECRIYFGNIKKNINRFKCEDDKSFILVHVDQSISNDLLGFFKSLGKDDGCYGRKVRDSEREKEEEEERKIMPSTMATMSMPAAKGSAHTPLRPIRLCLQPRAAHTLCLDQNIRSLVE
jgi:hypothetical protein